MCLLALNVDLNVVFASFQPALPSPVFKHLRLFVNHIIDSSVVLTSYLALSLKQLARRHKKQLKAS